MIFYNEQGERIGESKDATTELADGGERKTVSLTVESDVIDYAYATLQVKTLFGNEVTDLEPSARMSITDPAHPGLQLGANHVRRDGIFSVIRGQYQLDKTLGQMLIKGKLIFMDSKGLVLGSAPLHIQAEANLEGKGMLHAFECVVPHDVTNYSSIKLEITD
ncbi:hypothetical protein [Paenibacillus sp. SI8]|uniref:hypothetical protein n=1 Tax=unclassified Paenibacillus TaxID=185978 RepID=UPI003466BFF8